MAKGNCTVCPNDVGDSYKRDCAFPDCVGGWESLYVRLQDENKKMRALHDVVEEYVAETGEVPGNSDFWKKKFRTAIGT